MQAHSSVHTCDTYPELYDCTPKRPGQQIWRVMYGQHSAQLCHASHTHTAHSECGTAVNHPQNERLRSIRVQNLTACSQEGVIRSQPLVRLHYLDLQQYGLCSRLPPNRICPRHAPNSFAQAE